MFCACCLSLLLYLLKWAQLLPLSMTVSVVQVLCNSRSIFSVCVLSSRRSSCKIHVAAAVQLIQSPTIFELLEQFPRVLLLKQLFSVCLDCTSIFQPSDYFCCSFPSQLKANTKKRVVSYFRNAVDVMKKSCWEPQKWDNVMLSGTCLREKEMSLRDIMFAASFKRSL